MIFKMNLNSAQWFQDTALTSLKNTQNLINTNPSI